MSYEHPVLDHVGHHVKVKCGVAVEGIIDSAVGPSSIMFSKVFETDVRGESEVTWNMNRSFFTPNRLNLLSGDENYGFECLTCTDDQPEDDDTKQVMAVLGELQRRNVHLTFTQAARVTEFIKELMDNGTN